MSDADIYRRKADDLLRAAARTEDLGERSRLISEAVRWNMMAQESEAPHKQADEPAPSPHADTPASSDPQEQA